MIKIPLEKSIDHRNEGFTAKDAFNEQWSEASAVNRVSVRKKEGLKMYTEKEQAEKAGDVTEYNYNLRYSWEAFKKMPTINRQEYIAHLRKKYPGVTAKDFGDMFGVSGQSVANHLQDTNQRFGKGWVMTEGIRAFRADMVYAHNVVGFEKTPAARFELAPVPSHEPEDETSPAIPYDVQKLSVVCDAENASEVLAAFGLEGRVYLTVEVIEEKEVA